MSFLEEGSLADIALEFLLPGMFLHVPGHVFGGDGLTTNATVCSLLTLGNIRLLVVSMMHLPRDHG